MLGLISISFQSKRPYIHPADVISSITPADLRGANPVIINMPLRESAAPNVTPEGPLLLATRLRREYGVHATIIDLNGHRIKDNIARAQGLPNGRHLTRKETFQLIQDHFSKYGEPDLVAFSGMITTLRWQEDVTKMIRKLLPDVFLVSGAGLATQLKTGLFNYIPELDGVAHSEGDDIIVKMVYDALLIKKMGRAAAIASGKMSPYYIGEMRGKDRFMYEGNRPRNLDKLPFADLEILAEDVRLGRNLLEQYLLNAVWGTSANNSSATSFRMSRSTSSVSSRGCPHACKFCYRGAQGERQYGVRGPENLVEELLFYLEKYCIDFHAFVDDNFAVQYSRILKMHEIMKNLGIRWGTHTRLDEASSLRPSKTDPSGFACEDPKRVDLMAEMGCIYIGFGAESASARVLTSMDKGSFTLANGMEFKRVNGNTYQFPRSYTVATENCLRAGIHANCTWIMGYPDETLADLKTSVAFIKWQEELYSSLGKSPDSVNKKMFTATWYPGTEMLEHPKVKDTLENVFGLTFEEVAPKTFEPVCDENFHNYLLDLDDATKILHDPHTGAPLYFGEMPMDQFLEAREHIDNGETFKILEMK
jgi:radical SAM superfamily enzyme YgiQ (UPF0313 family)